MRNPRAVTSSALAVMLVLAVVVLAQEPGAPQDMPMPPQPGPEQAVLKSDVGVWDATVEMFMMPGAPPAESKGVETNTMGCGGMCLVSEFESEIMGQPFRGHGVTVYDAVKKKYVGFWMDSMSLGPSFSETVFDSAAKTMTGAMEGPDMSGQVSKMITRGEWKDADTRVWSMSTGGPEGTEVLNLRITYKRRK